MGPADIAPPTMTALATVFDAREPVRGHANACQMVLARTVIASYPRLIVDPPRLRFLSRGRAQASRVRDA